MKKPLIPPELIMALSETILVMCRAGRLPFALPCLYGLPTYRARTQVGSWQLSLSEGQFTAVLTLRVLQLCKVAQKEELISK